MSVESKEPKINWYRSPVDRETLARLNQRSDWQGFVQTGGHLGLLALTAATAWYSANHLPWPITVLIIYLHGAFWAFLLNAFHELCHKSVFKTKALNQISLQIVSFIAWNNPVFFWASHQEHHKYTLHPPDDLEVTLPVKLTLASFLKSAVINPWDLYWRLRGSLRLCFGKLDGEWANALFPESAVELRRSLFTWARIHLIGQLLIAVISLAMGWWLVPVLFTLAPFYGGGLQYLCNNTQHSGLQDETNDYRLCTRTIYLNPFVRFLYWQMNYHIEHHMYAAVPCYNLPALHKHIQADLPPTPSGLVESWKLINTIMQKQKADPSYFYIPELPSRVA
jgi:fatty acid desaturase